MTAAGPDPVAAHVAELDRALRGPAGARRSLVREVGDGLDDAVDAYRRAGFTAGDATRAAVRDFGPVPELTALYQDELTAGQGRRTALLLATGVPAVLVGWNLLWSSPLAAAPPGSPAIMALARVQDVAGVVVATAATILVVLASGRAASSRRMAVAAVVAALTTVVVCGGVAVAMLFVRGSGAWEQVAAQPGALAYLASATLLVLMTRSAVRTARTLRGPVPC